jgi:hypothetical protein
VLTNAGLDCQLSRDINNYYNTTSCRTYVSAGASVFLTGLTPSGSSNIWYWWDGACHGDGPCTLTMNGDQVVTIGSCPP